MQNVQANGKAAEAKNEVQVVTAPKISIDERLSKIAELEKMKSYYNKIKERETLLQELDFSDNNRNQGLTIIDSQGYKFEVTSAPVIKEVVDILLKKLRDEKEKVELFLINASM